MIFIKIRQMKETNLYLCRLLSELSIKFNRNNKLETKISYGNCE